MIGENEFENVINPNTKKISKPRRFIEQFYGIGVDGLINNLIYIIRYYRKYIIDIKLNHELTLLKNPNYYIVKELYLDDEYKYYYNNIYNLNEQLQENYKNKKTYSI